MQSAADVEQLATAQLLAVGITRPRHTPEQMQRIIALARQYAEAKVQTWLPLDAAGRKAMWQLVQQLLPEVFVRVPITTKTNNGAFAGKAPADLTTEQLEQAADLIRQQGA